MTGKKFRLFVSSVQKELENERLTVLALVTTDSILLANCEAILYEYAPASPKKSAKECLDILDSCDVCLSIVGKEYGACSGALSATHQEYRRAKEQGLPILIFVKGASDGERDQKTQKWLEEIRADNFKYKRFGNILELQREVRASLLKLLKERYNIIPSSDEEKIAEQTIEAISSFETQALKRLKWQNMDQVLAGKLTAQAEQKAENRLSNEAILEDMMMRGLVWFDSQTNEHYATAAGIVLLGQDPSAVFPQSRFLADAYRAAIADGNPVDQEDIRGPAPLAIERVLAFIDRNTRHPMRVVGLERVRIDEYPPEALREALVNAVAHRNYEDAGRKIMVEVFPERIVISSPGLPPKPLTIQKLRSGRYKPCSRNPILAQSLSYFHHIEERGSGFRRMRAQMIDHGLENVSLGEDTGYFQVIFNGPGRNISKLRIPETAKQKAIAPSVEEKLNKRQKQIITRVLKRGYVTSGWCRKRFHVVYDTAQRDLLGLVNMGILEQVGRGRTTKYVEKHK
ncbi:MAG: ATP-binding protein [Candidatus Omnitrophota bacterium]